MIIKLITYDQIWSNFIKIAFLRSLEYIADSFYGVIPRKSPSIDNCSNAKVIVHRGWTQNKKNIENTLDAFRDCLGKGLFGIEFDVRWTKDFVPVVHHDETLKRVFGSSEILADLNWIEVQEKFPLIPSLEQVVAEFGGKIHLLIELKKEKFPDLSHQKEILKQVLSPINEGEDFHLLSLHTSNFESFDNFNRRSMVLVSTINAKEMGEDVKRLNCGGFMGHFFLMREHMIENHPETIIGVGYPRNRNSFKRELNRGDIHWIFTNHPGVFLKYRKKRLKRLSLNSRF